MSSHDRAASKSWLLTKCVMETAHQLRYGETNCSLPTALLLAHESWRLSPCGWSRSIEKVQWIIGYTKLFEKMAMAIFRAAVLVTEQPHRRR